MAKEYWHRPGTAHVEIVDGMVLVHCQNGDEKFKICTTIHGLRSYITHARQVLDEFETGQRGKIRSVSH